MFRSVSLEASLEDSFLDGYFSDETDEIQYGKIKKNSDDKTVKRRQASDITYRNTGHAIHSEYSLLARSSSSLATQYGSKLKHSTLDEKPLVLTRSQKGEIGEGEYSDLKTHLSSTHDIYRESYDIKGRVGKIMEIKAILHFILSYHVKLLECIHASRLQRLIPELERWLNMFLENCPLPSISFGPPIFLDAGTYIPRRWALKLTDRYLLGNDELSKEEMRGGPYVVQMPNWAIRSAVSQASGSILEANMRQIAISGQEAGEVAKALKDMPEIQSKFDAVLYISYSQHRSIEEVDELIRANTLSVSLVEERTHRILLLFDCSGDKSIHPQILRTLMARDYECLVLAVHRSNFNDTVGVDMVIMMEDHLLPLELFCQHAVFSYRYLSSAKQQQALDLVEQCDGDLFAVVLLAKELLFKTEDVWEAALDELKMKHSSEVEESASKAAIHFIWNRKDPISKLCLRWLATHSNEGLTTSSMVSSWLADGLVQTEGEGVELRDALTDSGFLENDRSYRFTIPKETKDFMLKYVTPLVGPPLTAMAIVDDAEIINLKSGEVSSLPDNPICSQVVLLCLQRNRNIKVIPPLFFQHMPLLSTLNLSHTSIKTLPASISAAVSLRKLFLRGCDLFLELPPEIGTLSELEVIDLEGTRVTHLPDEIAQLQKLQSLKLSFYACGENHRGNTQQILEGLLLFSRNSLKELWIGEDPDAGADEWIADIHSSCYKNLSSIVLHVPDAVLLGKYFKWGKKYKLTVGHSGQRMISRIPSDVEEKFYQQTRLLKYVNGERIPTEIMDILRHSNTFILDRHWTVKSLSEFATESKYWLRLCLLVECNELQTIFDGDYARFVRMEYLYIYYMKNLRSIWSGQTPHYFFRLKYLNLCTCMILDSVFSISLVGELGMLEELVVEDCPKIESLVYQDCAQVHQEPNFLPRLKKISLRELPEIVSISNGIQLAPNLEKLVIFYCPKLESISEVLGGNLKVIKGETEWWDSLSWKETDPLINIFVPLQRDGDLMAQFTED